ncbi:MAG: hypothetical protein CVU11_06630 [Bacteroidetes bacterium HGW-Bacteroidetes-6]|jgi:hypothetical protein|nr:MAG: hypothetical protein CVU11_06630 [Bacteroidetes bacterium HGW-Bacteroidetes-6]
MRHFFLKTLLWLALALPFQLNAQITMNDISFWIGSGTYSAALVVDFNDGTSPQCFVWGYRFSDPSTTAEDMIRTIDSVDHALQVSFVGGFLSDINYLTHSGIGGNPDYFASFFGDGDSTNWVMNMGTSEVLTDSVWFGLSYTPWDTAFNPVYVPGLPVAASPVNAVAGIENAGYRLWPNPVAAGNSVRANFSYDEYIVYDAFGRMVLKSSGNNSAVVDVSGLLNACYTIVFMKQDGQSVQQILIVQ